MQEVVNNDPIYFVGDIHGRFGDLKDDIIKQDIRDCTLICVGDYGIGFNLSFAGELETQKKLNEFFKLRNIQFLTIRGNHDDPTYFKGATRLNYSNLELLEDYTFRNINGENFLFVGGAVSIDRRYRKELIDYWIDEIFIFDEKKVQSCDVLVAHSAPTWIGPFDKDSLSGWCKNDPTLWDECFKERKEHDALIKLSNPNRFYCGHFHETHAVDFNDCYGRILSELEILEHHPRNGK